MASGAAWMVLAKLAERSLALVSMLILARVLVPQDFGIVAMAMSFVALLEMLTAFGFDVALIQKQTKERGHWDTVWTFTALVGFAIAILMVLFAPAVARFFDEPRLVEVVRVLAIGSAVQGLQNVGLVAFRTEMQFDREFRFLTTKKLLGFSVTVPLALILDSYWALVIGQTCGRIASTGLSYWVHPYRPRFTLVAARDLFHFSKWMFILNIIHYIKDRSAIWVVGAMTGPAPLGAFTISYELATMPSTQLVAPINRAVFPAYARLAQEGIEPLRREYLSVIGVIVLLATPVVLGIAATAPVLVPVMLGPKWTHAVPLLSMLAIFGYTYIIQSNAQAAYLALGRIDVPTRLNGLHAALQFVAHDGVQVLHRRCRDGVVLVERVRPADPQVPVAQLPGAGGHHVGAVHPARALHAGDVGGQAAAECLRDSGRPDPRSSAGRQLPRTTATICRTR